MKCSKYGRDTVKLTYGPEPVLCPDCADEQSVSAPVESQSAGSACDHILGYTFDFEGPSIFRLSEGPGYFREGKIRYWNYCPECGEKLNPQNVKHEDRRNET